MALAAASVPVESAAALGYKAGWRSGSGKYLVRGLNMNVFLVFFHLNTENALK